MASRKPSARAKQAAVFSAGIADEGFGDDFLDDVFSRERERDLEIESRRESARYEKACASKNRYATRGEALAAIRSCEDHGRRGLSCYKCSYCGGWHLTSHPWDKD